MSKGSWMPRLWALNSENPATPAGADHAADPDLSLTHKKTSGWKKKKRTNFLIDVSKASH